MDAIASIATICGPPERETAPVVLCVQDAKRIMQALSKEEKGTVPPLNAMHPTYAYCHKCGDLSTPISGRLH